MEDTNPFAKFTATRKQVEIKSLGAVVTLRQQTIAEAHDYRASLYSDVGLDNKPKVDYAKVGNANLKKVASCLLDPKMTLEDFQGLGKEADKVISDILTEIEDWDGSERRMKAEAKRIALELGTKEEDEFEKLASIAGN